jgi:hypothetical protein
MLEYTPLPRCPRRLHTRRRHPYEIPQPQFVYKTTHTAAHAKCFAKPYSTYITRTLFLIYSGTMFQITQATETNLYTVLLIPGLIPAQISLTLPYFYGDDFVAAFVQYLLYTGT